MDLNLFGSIKKKRERKRFKRKVTQEKRKLFIESFFDRNKAFKKRKRLTLKVPNFGSLFSKKILLKFFISFFGVVSLFSLGFIFSPYFNLATINIDRDSSSQDYIDLNISYNSVNSYRYKNIIFIDKQEMANQIISYQKNIYKVSIKKQFFPPELDIKLWSYKPIFYTDYNGKKYLIMENGVFIPASNNQLKDLNEIKLSLSTNTSLEFIDYKKILKEKYLKKIVNLQKSLTTSIKDLTIQKIYYFEKEREVHFMINDNVILIFDISDSYDEELKKLIVFNKEHIDLTKANDVYYIDLRISNKIFYCQKSDSGYCKYNLQLLYNLYD